MNNKKRKNAAPDIPYFRELESFYRHLKAGAPLHKDFDIRLIDSEALKNYDYVASPFHHSFYCITFFLQGDITLNSGFSKVRLRKPTIYLKTPLQILSWQKPEHFLQEYILVSTENFLADHKLLADIIFDLPFFHLEKAIPFEIEQDEVELIAGIYKQVLTEYQSNNKDKFALITSCVYTLLLHLLRFYNKYTKTDVDLPSHVHSHERLLVDKFHSLIRSKIATGETNNGHLTVKYFAGLLSTHPNHLNAAVKRQKQKSALAFLHERILHEAQSLLDQTELTIKEIALRLGFADASHFNNFFKKRNGRTPALYRKIKSS